MTSIEEMRKALVDRGWIIGERDPRLNTDFRGQFMVAEPYEECELPTRNAANGPRCIVGDNPDELIESAYSGLLLPD